MNEENYKLAQSLVNSIYISQASDAERQREKLVKILLSQRKMPKEGWNDQNIEHFLIELSSMDSNNFQENVGVGEREGRIFSGLVKRRNHGFAHGVGRSGELAAIQPKAAGSSLLYKITNFMALDAIHMSGIQLVTDCIVAPLATGMSLSLCLNAWVNQRPKAKYVIFSRIDQKTCLKCILAAGLIPIIVELETEEQQQSKSKQSEKNIQDDGNDGNDKNDTNDQLNQIDHTDDHTDHTGDHTEQVDKHHVHYSSSSYSNYQPKPLNNDELRTNVLKIQEIIDEKGSDNILAVLSTTSCFAPRSPDNVVEISKICKKSDIFHLINNAYGLQCSKITHQINESIRIGRVDAIVQSTDKNFMVPVGGSIIASSCASTLDNISKTYPGRASSSPIIDLFITLLSMGQDGYKKLLKDRKESFKYMKEKLIEVAKKYDEKILDTPNNTISIGFTLNNFKDNDPIGNIGSKLFGNCTSGVRVVLPGTSKKTNINGYEFIGYGSHLDKYHSIYFTAAAAIGVTKDEIDLFIKRLDKILKKASKSTSTDKKQ